MANPTTNYGFVLPTPTDLVTDLPADFDVALQGVDTRLKALQPGTTAGDLVYASSTANTNVRLGIGSNGQVLSIAAGVPAWATTADQTPLTTKGDLFTFTTVDARIGIGANNTVLTADSAEATGMKWATPTGSMTLINSGGTALTGASVTIASIPQTFKSLELVCVNFGSANINAGLRCRINNDSAARYSFIATSGTQTFAQTSLHITGGNAITPTQGISTTSFPDYTNTTTFKMQISNTFTNDSTTPTSIVVTTGVGAYNQLVAITSLVLLPFSGNFTNGTAFLYGVN